ncbi:hypothetical protein CFC21_046554 [Triticum aestivum]|uniref:Zinc finger GRF-type domain-containing protein n=2 Tax=Triticum aestivum TaxID=4565 RepID=A0A3B6GTI9_WHEAT|nr:hypothetical protein CFC21_046554 [Triticum aestivum]
MSSSSIGSACSHGGAIRRRGAAARSPVPYREQPMEYEPAVFCGRCGRKAPRWISWSVANPGRRYYSCVEAQVCSVLCPPMLCSISLSYKLLSFEQHGFIQWHDDLTSPFLRVLLGDLRDRVRS